MLKVAAVVALAALTIGFAGVFAPQRGWSAETVLGEGFAQQCYRTAKLGGDLEEGIADCSRALATDPLSTRDLAGTYINRAVLRMAKGDYVAAREDLEQSIKLDSGLGEAYVNLGGAEIALGRYAAGVANINQGLALGPEEPEKAYYNRAIAEEALDDEKSAYFDYAKAAALNPTWDAPRTELARFTVRSAP